VLANVLVKAEPVRQVYRSDVPPPDTVSVDAEMEGQGTYSETAMASWTARAWRLEGARWGETRGARDRDDQNFFARTFLNQHSTNFTRQLRRRDQDASENGWMDAVYASNASVFF
jgi:hypothetical protein